MGPDGSVLGANQQTHEKEDLGASTLSHPLADRITFPNGNILLAMFRFKGYIPDRV
jgi:hypothetical protein